MESVEVGGTLEGHKFQPLQGAGTFSTQCGPTSPQMFPRDGAHPVLGFSGQERHRLKVSWKIRGQAHLIYEGAGPVRHAEEQPEEI